MGDRPRGIKVSPDGNTYLATLEWGNKFMVMDKDFNVVRTVDTGETPYGISYDNTGERIYVAAKKAKTLEVYDAKTYEKSMKSQQANVAGISHSHQMTNKFYSLAVNQMRRLSLMSKNLK